MTVPAEAIAAAFTAACRDELDAPKPGNVHPLRRRASDDGIRLRPERRGGRRAVVAPARGSVRILAAVEATLAAVGTNTNRASSCCAPLAAAAEAASRDLRASPRTDTRSLDVGRRARLPRHRAPPCRARARGAPRRVRARDGHAQGGHGRGVAARSHRPPIRQRFRRRLRARASRRSPQPCRARPIGRGLRSPSISSSSPRSRTATSSASMARRRRRRSAALRSIFRPGCVRGKRRPRCATICCGGTLGSKRRASIPGPAPTSRSRPCLPTV